MIPLTDVGWQGQTWQWLLSNAVTDINELVRLLDLPVTPVETDFPLLVPLSFLARMERGNPHDPLLRQVLPLKDELSDQPGYKNDPLGEADHTPTRGLLHKYHGRVLVVTSGACAVNCRYCFRRHFPYDSFQPDSEAWQEIFNYVVSDPSITEVILSGGDPLVLSDKRLSRLATSLADIEHVTTLRIHTRLPIVIPGRVDKALTEWIRDSRFKVVVVIHANHANEIDATVADAMRRLRAAGATLLNQSVLLRGVNDSSANLIALSQRLFEVGVLPYYLHLFDPVRGATHFDVPESEGQQIIREVSSNLPGYLVPRLVREVPGAPAKSLRSWPTGNDVL